MCLINTFEKPNFKIGKFWKILRRRIYVLRSPFFHQRWNYGVNQCNQFDLVRTNDCDTKISNGIHVFETKETAEHYKCLMTNSNFTKEELVIVPVTAEEEDLIAIGYQEGLRDIKTLCFKQVYLAREDYEKALTNTETEV